MSQPTRHFERLAVSRGLAHDGNPVLAWMLSGCMIVRDSADNVKVAKQKSTTRVDGIIASIMAVAGAMADKGPSVYQRRGLITL
jgi:phage terminase large subunit-like protein